MKGKFKKTVAIVAVSAVTAMTAMFTGCSFIDKIKEEIDYHFGSTPETETTACVEHTDDDFDYLCDECNEEVFYETETVSSGCAFSAGKYRLDPVSVETNSFCVLFSGCMIYFYTDLTAVEYQTVPLLCWHDDQDDMCTLTGVINYTAGYVNFIVDENFMFDCESLSCDLSDLGALKLLGLPIDAGHVQKITGIHTECRDTDADETCDVCGSHVANAE